VLDDEFVVLQYFVPPPLHAFLSNRIRGIVIFDGGSYIWFRSLVVGNHLPVFL
jgi:hypothetical protein